MEVIIRCTPEEATALAARTISRLVHEKPNAVLGLATGSTPLLLYHELVRLHREHQLDFSQVTTFNLDEYVGLGPDDPRSYHHFMREHLFGHVNIAPQRAHIPDGLAPNIPAFCARYEEQIKAAGGIDLQVLGIGAGGHIGFNEPTSSFASRTRIKTLTTATRKANGHFFDGEEKVPHHAITMGIGTILEARQCMLLAFGEHKAQAVAGAVEGPITAMNPASSLQLHPRTKVFLDAAAAAMLQQVEYYQSAYDNKPDWLRDA
jgi:glucosamine-6-phosphate deaminase